MSRTSITSKNKGLGILLIFFALVIVAVGALMIGTDLAGPGEAFPIWGWAIMAVTVVPLLAIGAVLVARGLRVDHVYKAGLPGEATVLSATRAAYGVGAASDTDYRVTAVLKVDLEVNIPGHPPYQVRVNEIAPGLRVAQLRPGAKVPVRADPKKLTRVVIDWDRDTAAAMGQLGLGLPAGLLSGGLLSGGMLSGGVPVMAVPQAASAAGPMAPALPAVAYTGTESPETLRATVRQVGLPGTATIDAVTPTGVAPDGRHNFVLGMWVHIGGPAPLRVDNAPAAVEYHLVHKVAIGAKVPVRVAQIGASQATVLLWDEA